MPRIHHPVRNCTRAFIRMSAFGSQIENILAYRWPGPDEPTLTQLTSLVNELSTTVAPLLRGLVGAHVRFNEIYARNEQASVANEATYVFPVNTFGTRSGTPAAMNTACGIVKRTGLTGYGQHGRNSISGFVEGDVDGNDVGSALMSLLGSLALQILADRVSGYFVSGVAHIPRVPLLEGTVSRLTSADVIDNLVDSQKTRLTGHGR